MSILADLIDGVGDALRDRWCSNPSDMIDRVRWAFQNDPLSLPSAPALISSLLPRDCGQLPPQSQSNPIPGGQCAGVLYNVLYDRIRPDGTVNTNLVFANVPGPIGNLYVDFRRVGFNQDARAFVVLIAPNSTEGSQPGRLEFGPSSYTDEGRQTRIVLRSIARVDGQPDNCGNGPPQPEPPIDRPPPGQLPPVNITIGPNNYEFSPTFNFNPTVNIPINAGVHIPVDITIAPNIVFPTGVQFPIYIKLPEFTVNQTISGPFIEVDVNTGGGGVPQVELATDRLMVGINIQCNADNARTVSVINGTDGQPNLYVPSLATVRFVPPAGFSGVVGTDVLVKTLNQFVPCPWFFGAGSYRVLPQPGVTFVAQAVFADVARLVKPV